MRRLRSNPNERTESTIIEFFPKITASDPTWDKLANTKFRLKCYPAAEIRLQSI